MTDDPDLKAAYALQTPDDSRKLYADWAKTYDSEFVEAERYILHEAVAHAFKDAGGAGPVLDIGAGTGLCGQVLADLCILPVDGTDISPQMLDQARTKGVYARLFEGDILAGLDCKEGSYRGVVSAGTFTLGHVGPEGLEEVLRVLEPGGWALISVRDTHFEAAGFGKKLEELAADIAAEKRTVTPIYAKGAYGEHANDQAILLHLRRK